MDKILVLSFSGYEIELLTKRCVVCKERTKMRVNRKEFERWISGILIQDAFPDLNKDEREMLISGTHPSCWNKLLPE